MAEAMTKHSLLLVGCVLLLSACAGGPIAIKSSPNMRTVVVDGVSIDVAEDSGVWSATHSSFASGLGFLSPADIARRGSRHRRAIELASGCKVLDASTDNAGAAMSATVSCSTPTGISPR